MMKRLLLLLTVVCLCSISLIAAIKREPLDLLRASKEAFENRDYDKSIDLLTQAIDANSKHAPAYVLRGLAYSGKNKLDLAIEDFSKAIQLTPNDERAYIFRAVTYQETKQWDKAINDYTEALNLKPGNLDALCNRGTCYMALSQHEKALSDFDTAINSDTKNPMPRQLRANLYGQMGEKEKALDDFKVAIGLDSNNPGTYLNRAHFYLVEGEPELALKDLEEVMKRAPEFSGAANDYAWTLATNPKDAVRNGSRAVEFAKKACHETDYKHAPTVDTLAASYAEAGDWAEAVKWQSEAIRLAETTHPDEVKGMKERLESFQNKKAYREEPKREQKANP
jgi:tetratricopeptide (TPR) repeat protein